MAFANLNSSQTNNYRSFPGQDWSGDDAIIGAGNNNYGVNTVINPTSPHHVGGLQGYGGADYIDGGDGDDDLYGYADQRVVGGADTAVDGNDWLVGGNGNDNLYGQVGDDQFNPGSGNNIVDGGTNALISGVMIGLHDVVNYADITDAIVANLSTGIVQHGIYTDTLIAIEDVQGSNLSDSITGDSNDNILYGIGGDDTLDGGGGVDTAVFSGDRAFYSVSLVNGLLQIVDLRTQQQIIADTPAHGTALSNGTDTLSNFEWFRFKDRTYTLRELFPDDYGDAVGSLAPLPGATGVGVPAFGDIEIPGDRDAFAVSLVAGQSYTFNLRGSPSGNGTLPDPYLWFYDQAGNWISENDDSAGNLESRIVYTAQVSGSYFLVAGGFSARTGTYTLVASVNATASADTLTGTDLPDRIFGLGGNDTLYGRARSDALYGGPGNDTVYGGRGNDAVYGGTGNDVLDGGAVDDALYGGAGNDVLVGGLGADRLFGGGGIDRARYSQAGSGLRADLQAPDTNTGEAAGDTYVAVENLFGSGFNDVLLGNGGANALYGYLGNDVLYGRAGNDALYGRAGNDELYGGGGNDALSGGAGNDTLAGSTGDDRIAGGAGADRLSGGDGADAFVFSASSDSRGNAVDTIADWQDGLDSIDLSAIDANTTAAATGNQAFGFSNAGAFSRAAGELIVRAQGAHTHVLGDVNGDGQADLNIRLAGSAFTIDPADFVL